MTWYGSCTALNRKALQRVVKTAQNITRTELPSMEDLCSQRLGRSADETLWGAKRLRVYVLYDHFLITMTP